MTLPLELGGIRDPMIRRALEALSQQFPVVAAGGGGGAPTGAAGGDLGSTYPNPTVVKAQTGFTVGGVAVVLSTDAALTNARTPTAHHTTHEPGGTDAMAVDAGATTGSLRTIGTGALQAAAGNDARLTNARAPTAHATTHQPGGTDAMAVDAIAATGSLRTLGTAATSAAAGNRGLPVGGTGSQVLAKNTATDYDVGWTTPAVGAAPTYDALQQGVLAAGDCALTVNTTAQVTIAAGVAYVTVSGALTRTAPGSTVLGSIPAASASNFRLDQVVVSSAGTVSRLAGTQGTTVTLANRTGAASIPAGSMLLHDILVASTGVTLANCRDRRPWARGAYFAITRNANAAATNNYTTASASQALVDGTNLQPRIECSGVPMRATLRGGLIHTVAGSSISVTFFLDGTAGTNVMGTNSAVVHVAQTTLQVAYMLIWDFVPAAGSHLIAPSWATSAATATLGATSTIPLQFTVEEIVRQAASNT